jgi:hypothetical protein
MSTDYPEKYTARSSVIHIALSAALKNLAANTAVALTEYDNSAGDPFGDFDMYFRSADVVHAGEYISIWFLLKADGTNLEDGAAGVIPLTQPDLTIVPRLVSTQQRIVLKRIPIPNGKFTCLLLSPTSHGFTNTDNENTLDLYTYSYKTVAP